MKYLALLTTLFFTTISTIAQDTFKQFEGDTVPETPLEPIKPPQLPMAPVAPPPPPVPGEGLLPPPELELEPPPTPKEIEAARLAIPSAHRPPPAAFVPIPSTPGHTTLSNVVVRHTIVRDGVTFGTEGKGFVSFSGSGPRRVEVVGQAKGMIQGLYASNTHPLLWQDTFNSLNTPDSKVEAIWQISGPSEAVQRMLDLDEATNASVWWVEGLADMRTPLKIHFFFWPNGAGRMVAKRGENIVAASSCLTAKRTNTSESKQLAAGEYPIDFKSTDKDEDGIPYRLSGEVHVKMPYFMSVQTLTGKGMHGGNTSTDQGDTAHGCIRLPAFIEAKLYQAAKVKETVVVVHHEEE